MNSTNFKMEKVSIFRVFSLLLPGFLVAATGVGAGDLATASIVGSKLGVAVLWGVILGGVFKFILTEGLARWQLATESTFISFLVTHFGSSFRFLFLSYLLLWSYFVGSALMAANGIALYALFPLFDSAETGKIVYGLICSFVVSVLIWFGNYKLFEKLMFFLIGTMFVIVVYTLIALWPGFKSFFHGVFVPKIPQVDGALSWIIALIGGVGGTLTIFCYGYWIEENGRRGTSYLRGCRFDLAAGYLATVLFGMGMVIIGSSIEVDGKGTRLLIQLADSLENTLGEVARWLFLIGAFAAVFSSMLGVWQAVPYLFADVITQGKSIKKENLKNKEQLTNTKAYWFFLLGLATIPSIGLFYSFTEMQKMYALIGTLFMPLLAVALIGFNSQKKWLGKEKNSLITNVFLSLVLFFFAYSAWLKFSIN